MTDCFGCQTQIEGIPYTCSYCGGKFCADDRLPEAHACISLEAENPNDNWFKQ